LKHIVCLFILIISCLLITGQQVLDIETSKKNCFYSNLDTIRITKIEKAGNFSHLNRLDSIEFHSVFQNALLPIEYNKNDYGNLANHAQKFEQLPTYFYSFEASLDDENEFISLLILQQDTSRKELNLYEMYYVDTPSDSMMYQNDDRGLLTNWIFSVLASWSPNAEIETYSIPQTSPNTGVFELHELHEGKIIKIESIGSNCCWTNVRYWELEFDKEGHIILDTRR
jgi:hypothetical protein